MPEGTECEGGRPSRTILQLRVGSEASEPQLMTTWLLKNPDAKVCECGEQGDVERCRCSAIVQRIVSRGEAVLNGKRISSEAQTVKAGDSLKLTRVVKPPASITDEDGAEDVLSQEVAMLLTMLGNEHKAYWNSRYAVELDAVDHAQRDGEPDPLEKLFVWFGRMAMLMTIQTITNDLPGVTMDTANVLDIGCGNGFFVEVLHALGCAKVTGSDYSPDAIRLCKRVQKHFREQKPEVEAWGSKYVLDDILQTKLSRESFDVINDSGTLDSIAMTLPPEDLAQTTPDNPFHPPPAAAQAQARSREEQQQDYGENGAANNGEEKDDEFEEGSEDELHNGEGALGYFRNVAALLKSDGWLVLRSCNHSADEIASLLQASSAPLALVRESTAAAPGVRTVLLRKQPPPTATAPSA